MPRNQSTEDPLASKRISELPYSLLEALETHMATRRNAVWEEVKEYIKQRVGILNAQEYSDQLWNANTPLTTELDKMEDRAKEKFDKDISEVSKKIGRWMAEKEKDWLKRFRSVAKSTLDRDSTLSSYSSSMSGSQMSGQQQFYEPQQGFAGFLVSGPRAPPTEHMLAGMNPANNLPVPGSYAQSISLSSHRASRAPSYHNGESYGGSSRTGAEKGKGKETQSQQGQNSRSNRCEWELQ